jgi:hypothetical protein
MGIGTFVIGLVPPYASIGVWGGILLTILRTIQGIGLAANGAARSCCPWSGARTTKTAASSPAGRIQRARGLLLSNGVLASLTAGGSALLIAVGLLAQYNSSTPIVIYMVICAAISIVSAAILRPA